MRQPYVPFHLILAFPLCTHLFTITGTPEVAVTIQTRTSRHGSLHVYKPALLLVEEGIVLESSRFLFHLSFCLLTRVFPRPSNRLAELLSARSWPVSRACQPSVDALCSLPFFSLFSPSLYCLDDTFTLATPILDAAGPIWTVDSPSFARHDPMGRLMLLLGMP